MKKITLSADDEVIRQAKILAERGNTSISAMFSRFVKMLAGRGKSKDEIPADSIASRATGYIKPPKGKSTDDILADSLMDKYGIKR